MIENLLAVDTDALVERLTTGSNLFWVFVGSVAIVSIVFGAVSKMVQTSTRERTKREIAAYIAAGTMTAEQGERLLKGHSSTKC